MKQQVMVTRPALQAAKLAAGINATGAEAFLFPTLEIAPLPISEDNKKVLKQIEQYDIVIFISPNAVKHGLKQIQTISALPQHTLIATIGQGSANTLKTLLGKPADIVPEKNFNSEGLLATASLQNVSDKRILIIRGKAGREHLKTTLEQRGASVDYLNVYQRIKPETNTADLEQYLQNKQIAAIVITSTESLKNLLEMTPEKFISQLQQVPLLLINTRLIEVAKEAGFSGKLSVATEASDAGIIESLKKFIC